MSSRMRAKEHTQQGIAYVHQGRIDDAIREFRSALEICPDDPMPRFELTNLLREQRRWEELARELEEFRSVCSFPDDPGLLSDIAHAKEMLAEHRKKEDS